LITPHPHPSSLAVERFSVKHPTWERGARIAPDGICAGVFRKESSYRDIRDFEGLYQGAIFTALEIDYDIKRKEVSWFE